MTLADAISKYVALRRGEGSPFVSSERTLLSFSKRCGLIRLEHVTSHSVELFLEAGVSEVTKRSRFSGVKCFLEHCAVRGLMPHLLLKQPRKPRQRRTPLIFTQAQIRAMLRAADLCQSRAFELQGSTLRMAVLLLYATGAAVDEVLSLLVSDVDTKKRALHFRGTFSRPQRTLPIGRGLATELKTFLAAKETRNKDEFLLTSSAGKPLSRGYLCERFAKLQRSVLPANGDSPGHGAAVQAGRLQDLRYTFAVHRLKACIERGGDLTKLVPALSSYMGYAGLLKAEEFLAFTPERFIADLRRLTPIRSEPTWISNNRLLEALKKRIQ